MKVNLKPTLYALSLCAMFTSCNRDDLLDPNAEYSSTTEEPVIISADMLINAKPGETITINGIIDLEGETIDLASNVKLVYEEGGDIVDGTINISDNTEISSELLNNSLKLSGATSTAKIMGSYFFFYPDRWGIVQGKVTDAVALNNRKIFQDVLDEVSSLGATMMFIDKMDAYFYVGGNHSLDSETMKDAICLPSNFSLKMSSNTYLRVQPNDMPRGNLLAIYRQENVSVSGGNLVGDRYEHVYTPMQDEFGFTRSSHEWPTLLCIAGAKDVLVVGVKMSNSTGDGLMFTSGTNRFYTPVIYCDNVTVKSCTISGNRRNNITVGDAENVYIQNCTITDAGGGEPTFDSNGTRVYDSTGVAPQFGLDLEAHRELVNGSYEDYQKVQNVYIRWNTFKNNYAGDIDVFTANDVMIEHNNVDSSIVGVLCYNTTIRNNTLVQRETVKSSVGIRLNPVVKTDGHKSYNNKIIGNTISGYDTGISPGGQYIEVKENIIRDFKEAIYINKDLADSEISNNDFQSDRSVSYGYMAYGGIAKNVVVKNDKVVVKHRPILLWGFNRSSDNTSLTFDGCDFTSNRELYLENTNNVTIKNSNLLGNKEIRQINCTNVITSNIK